jgi:hypothetical protein
MFNCIDIYSFIPVSGCLGRGPIALLFPGAYYAIKTALVISTLPCKKNQCLNIKNIPYTTYIY